MTKKIEYVLSSDSLALLTKQLTKQEQQTKLGKRNPIIINHYKDSKKMARERERGRELKCNPSVNLEGAAYRIHNIIMCSC